MGEDMEPAVGDVATERTRRLDEARRAQGPGPVAEDPAGASPTPEELAGRLRNTFSVAYLTLTGVTQSVATAVLAARVEATYEDFDPVHWVLVVNTFLAVVLVWNDYLIAAIAYVWPPTLADAFFPFTLLAMQLVVAHDVYPDPRAWFAGVSVFLAVGTGAFAYGFRQVRCYPSANRDVLRAIGVHQHLTMAFTGAGCLVALVIALLWDVVDLSEIELGLALLGTVIIAATLARSVPYWNRVTAYAGVRPDPGSRG